MTGKPEKDLQRKKACAFGIQIIVSVFIILSTTIFSRFPSLAHNTQLIPFWSYAEVVTGQRSPIGILLNIALFIPFGWFLVAFFQIKQKKLLVSLLPILLSITIELIQYFTGRGTADIDDVISNTLGGMIGALIYYGVERITHGRWVQLLIPVFSIFFLAATCIGAYTTYISPHLNSRLREYDFAIDKVSWDEDNLTISGRCSVYDGETPVYQLILSDGERRPLDTVIDNDHFTVSGTVDANRKYEVLIRFSGHEIMSTGTWIHDDKVEFIPGTLPIVDGVPDGAVLMAYDEKTDTLVFRDSDRLLWLIGSDIDPATEIIYHIHTDEPEKLPESRRRYGFDNKGFRTGTGSELEPIGHYRVFEREIPSDYHVAEVVVGFNAGGKLIWEQNYRVDYD